MENCDKDKMLDGKLSEKEQGRKREERRMERVVDIWQYWSTWHWWSVRVGVQGKNAGGLEMMSATGVPV